MRCVDVIEKLAAPTDDEPDSAVLSEHLASCPRCAAWARRDAQLERLWEATRPQEPAGSSWTTVWANVTQALDAAPEVTGVVVEADSAPAPLLQISRRPGMAR